MGKEGPMLVMRYGLLPPTENAELVRSQMRLAQKYRNTLVEIERGRRAAIRALYGQIGDMPALEHAAKVATEAANAAAKKVKLYKSAKRTGKVPEELRRELDQARVAKRDATAAWRAVRNQSRTGNTQLEADRINTLANELQKSARDHSGLYWGTSQLVDNAMDASRSSPLWGVWEGKVWCPLTPNDPKFVPWKGEGQIGVQIQGGMSCTLVFAEDRRLQIRRLPDKLGRGERCYCTLRIRVGSDDKLAPIWAEFPLKLHRPLPEGAIKRAYVNLQKIGPREEWSLHVVVDNVPIVRPSGAGAVGVNIGWRLLKEGGIRVAFAVDENGETHELVLSESMLSSLQKASELRSIRETRFNAAVAELSQWLKQHAIPEWLSERTRTMHLWESMGRLAALARHWRLHRFEGDSDAYDALERWRYRDHHLWCWESDQRVQSLRQRREVYRLWAGRLADRYRTIALHEHDLSRMARRSFDPDNDAARANRQLVAPSQLRLALVNAKCTRNGETVLVALGIHTQTCHACQEVDLFDAAKELEHTCSHWEVDLFDAAKELEHTCSHCGCHWDQDENNARNTLRVWVERPGEAKVVGAARKLERVDKDGNVKESKRARIARLQAEKEERAAAAAAASGCSAP
jgi:hypothetical protein